MALPTSWTQVKVYGTYLRLDGTPNSGQVWFDSAEAVNVTDTDGTTVLVVPKRLIADLDTNGYFEIMLPATTDSELDPHGWTYQVKERLTGGLEYSIDVPADLLTLNLVPMRPKLPDSSLIPATLNYLTTEDLGNTVGRQGDINTLNTQVATALADATSAVSTVNSLTTTVNAAADTANAASAIANALGDQVTAAQTSADQAAADASSALTTATNAQTDATNAINTANGLTASVTAAQTDASNALTAATAAQSAASDAQTAAAGALSTANGLADDVAAAQSSADAAQTSADNVNTALLAYEANVLNNSDPTKGSALVGHEGQTLKAYLDALVVSGGTATSAPQISFTQQGTGAQTQTLQNWLIKRMVSMTDFHQTADGSDYAPALTRALAYSARVYIPAGVWNINSPVNMVEAMHIEGAAECQLGGDGATKLICNAGFLINTSTGATGRKHITVKNIHASGNSNAVSLIKGPMGGVIEGCKLSNAATGVENPSSFLSRYYRCAFNTLTAFGLNLADFNGGRVMDCSFQDSVKCHMSVIDVTPQSGFNMGFPYVVSGGNHNCGGYPNNTMCKLRGRFRFVDNYFEDFTTSGTSGIIFLQVTTGPGDNGGAVIQNNEFNGQGHSKYAVLVKTTSAGSIPLEGMISHNRIIGFAQAGIHFGDADATTNAHVEGLKVCDNGFAGNGINIENGAEYRVAHYTSNTSATSVAGSTFITVPIGTSGGTTEYSSRSGNIGTNSVTPSKTGVYRLCARISVKTAQNVVFPDVQAAIFINGTQQDEIAHAQLIGQSGGVTTFCQLQLGGFFNINDGDVITVRVRQGDILARASFDCEWISDDCWQ